VDHAGSTALRAGTRPAWPARPDGGGPVKSPKSRGNRLLVAVPDPAPDPVPEAVLRQARAGGWPTCDVCSWPVHPAAIEPGRRPRHPACLCCVCGAPLTSVQPGVLWHPQCGPTPGTPRHLPGGRRRRVKALPEPSAAMSFDWRASYLQPPDVDLVLPAGAVCPLDDVVLQPSRDGGLQCPTCRGGWDGHGRHGYWPLAVQRP
jgi:hypothetical protein